MSLFLKPKTQKVIILLPTEYLKYHLDNVIIHNTVNVLLVAALE